MFLQIKPCHFLKPITFLALSIYHCIDNCYCSLPICFIDPFTGWIFHVLKILSDKIKALHFFLCRISHVHGGSKIIGVFGLCPSPYSSIIASWTLIMPSLVLVTLGIFISLRIFSYCSLDIKTIFISSEMQTPPVFG